MEAELVPLPENLMQRIRNLHDASERSSSGLEITGAVEKEYVTLLWTQSGKWNHFFPRQWTNCWTTPTLR